MTSDRVWMETAYADEGVWLLTPGGRWDLNEAKTLTGKLDALQPEREETPIRLDLSRLGVLDTVGALLLSRLADRLRREGHRVEVTALRPEHRPLFDAVHQVERVSSSAEPKPHPVIDMLERTGRATVSGLREGVALVSFLGLMTITLLRVIRQPSRLRYRSLMFHIEQTGLDALPILGLLSFLIGVVMAFQGADQLRRFGTELYVVNLLGISILRELGILMTAIIVAGRSGSAFTAQIGAMKINQEVDALFTLGFDPLEVLAVPRVLALVITLPLLAFYADVTALLGGATASFFMLDISYAQFIRQLHVAIGLNTFMVGIAKAPVFALVIALVGCYEGMKVSGNAESVGALTTRSVVEGIFLVIIMDALFSILFSFIGV